MCTHYFNFCVEEDEEERRLDASSSNSATRSREKRMAEENMSTAWVGKKPAKRLLAEDHSFLPSLKDVAQNCSFPPVNIPCVAPGAVLGRLLAADSSEARSRGAELKRLLTLADSEHSDLLPGVYEGGLKVWECAYDLVHHILTCEIRFPGLRVLELGCGAGLPGIAAILRGAESACFQDYNEEVLQCLTIPNLYLNTSAHPQLAGVLPRCRFYSGDWTDVTQLMIANQDVAFDVILTAETIYCTGQQPVLLQAIKDLLSPRPSSLVLVAAKTHYFGVGGSMQTFRELVENDGCLDIVSVKTIDSSLPRQILVLRPHTTQ